MCHGAYGAMIVVGYVHVLRGFSLFWSEAEAVTVNTRRLQLKESNRYTISVKLQLYGSSRLRQREISRHTEIPDR